MSRRSLVLQDDEIDAVFNQLKKLPRDTSAVTIEIESEITDVDLSEGRFKTTRESTVKVRVRDDD